MPRYRISKQIVPIDLPLTVGNAPQTAHEDIKGAYPVATNAKTNPYILRAEKKLIMVYDLKEQIIGVAELKNRYAPVSYTHLTLPTKA